ncbi:hypothetical protein APE01nite_10010 [Acetobacter peroxydans]|uniref:Uncharacterized protein n=1 Tax=Acetobacter peroxydans TaxID=104098 RepID=A0A4Y3TTY7_9PROT|nr:hypothetical protein AA13755_0365 [Acetobacter peroxydans NBRC 13755]GBR42814.1 hypothetical protein AA0475_1620 [Acetobacter peroxydans]GEB85204.1 hypothetical protein APE01nite_10010 [Acetobacter peroxydans]
MAQFVRIELEGSLSGLKLCLHPVPRAGCPLALGRGLCVLRLHGRGVLLGHDLACRYVIALVNRELYDPAGIFDRHINPGELKSAIAMQNAGRQGVQCHMVAPEQPPSNGGCQ